MAPSTIFSTAMKYKLKTSLALIAILMVGIGNEQLVRGQDLFSDVSVSAGIDLTHDGWSVGGMGLGTGAAWFDYDNDGDLDLYLTMRAGANRLYQNNGGTFTDVAAAAGVQDAGHDGSGVAVADYNNDGCKDLYLANNNEDVLYKNNCDGTFTDVTNTSGSDISVMQQARGTSASWGDYDDDGLVDLYVSNHAGLDGATIPGGTARQQAKDYLFHNNGDDTFTDVSDMLLGVTDREGMSFIGAWNDFDRDGDLDIYLIKDCPFSDTSPMKLWRNDGGTDGLTDWTFTEVSASANADYCQNGMGVAVGDYDRDGDMDYFYTDNGSSGDINPTRAGTILLANDGDGTFTDATNAANVSSTLFSWGANFLDYDLDGWLDLYMAAGRVFIEQTPDPNVLWSNDGDGTFSNVSATSGVDDPEHGRSPVFADYDGDGDPDLFLVNHGGTFRLFQNDNTNGNNWLIVDLEGTTSNRDGIGAWLELTTPDGVTQHYETRSGSSLGGGDDMGAYFGLGTNASITSLTINWPSGTVQTLTSLGINQRVLITEDGVIGNNPPVASFTSTVADLMVDVDASASTDDGSIVSYDWDFGDGNTGTGVTASHTYAVDGTYTISLTVTDDEGATGSTSDMVTVSAAGNNPPVASFISTTTDLMVDVDASASTDDGSIASYDWDFGDGNMGTGVTASHTYAVDGTYTITLTVTDDEGATGMTTSDVTVSDGGTGGTGAFVESAGLLSMEAENAQTMIERDGHSWISVTDQAGFSGASAMKADPDDNTRVRNNPETSSPELVFEADFTTTGTYYVWHRLWGSDVRGNKTYAGLNGVSIDDPLAATEFSTWTWVNVTTGGTSGTVEITSAGIQEINVWMGEDGVYFDKVVLSTDANFVPSGDGPAESPRDGNGDPVNQNPVADIAVTAGGTEFEFTFDGSGSTDDGSIVSYDWDFGDGNADTGSSVSHTYADYGTYTVTLTVTDDMGATGSDTELVVISDPNAVGAFIEADGMVVFEAENYHSKIDRDGHSWLLETANAGFSGAGYMLSDPDNGTQINSDPETESPEISFDIEFTNTGDYYVWGRLYAPNTRGNSIYVGYDGTLVEDANGFVSSETGAWTWVELQKGGNARTISVASAGAHTVQLWMREDGTSVDKVVLTTDEAFEPTGEGPDESPRATGAIGVAAKSGLDVEKSLIQDDSPALPEEFMLEGNYPNPFNPTTTIRFALPESGAISMAVYDMLGREVSVLVNGEMNAGWHEVQWDGRSYSGATVPSGVYLVRLAMGSNVQVHRVTLLK